MKNFVIKHTYFTQLTHYRFFIHGSTKYSSKSKDPPKKVKLLHTLPSVHIISSLPQQNDEQQKEEDIVDISGVHPTVFLQRPL